MKCPKCGYLGFETGNRCKNCGYDFSLMTSAPIAEDVEVELTLNPSESDSATMPGWLDSIDLHPMVKPADPQPATVSRGPHVVVRQSAQALPEPKLPLFSPASEDDGDEPLIKLPAAPRPPLAVRRTPEMPRLRAVPKPAPRVVREPEPVLEFQDVAARGDRLALAAEPMHIQSDASSPRARLAAAAVDHAILLGIDVAVIYLTLRIAGLAMGDWTALPLAPLGAFLLLVKLSYFCAFTAVGGQTIGKMAAHLRVVTEDGRPVNSAGAIRRTLAGALSTLVLGLGFLPALIAPDRRAFHDRFAGTRVVSQHSA